MTRPAAVIGCAILVAVICTALSRTGIFDATPIRHAKQPYSASCVADGFKRTGTELLDLYGAAANRRTRVALFTPVRGGSSISVTILRTTDLASDTSYLIRHAHLPAVTVVQERNVVVTYKRSERIRVERALREVERSCT